jgi:hypothetical protein
VIAGISLLVTLSSPAQTAPPAPILPANSPAPFSAGVSLSPRGASALLPPAVASAATRVDPSQPPHLEWRNGRLSVRAEDYPLSRIIEHVARMADVDVSGLDHVSGRASVSFSGQPLSQGFDLLLTGWDYAFAQPNPSLGRRGQLMILARGGPVPDMPKPGPAIVQATPGKGSDSNDDDNWDDDSPEEQSTITQLRQAAARGDQQTLKNAISNNNDAQIQQSAFDLLKAIDSQAAIDALLPATNSANAQVAVQSIALLQRSGADPDTILNALGEAMDSATPSVKAYAVQSLPNYGQDSLRFLLTAMSDLDRNIRFSVLQAAGRFPWAASIVQQAASDSDEQVRNLAAQFLRQQAQAQGQPPPPQQGQVQPNQVPGQDQQTIAGQSTQQDSDSDSDADQDTPDDDNSPN